MPTKLIIAACTAVSSMLWLVLCREFFRLGHLPYITWLAIGLTLVSTYGIAGKPEGWEKLHPRWEYYAWPPVMGQLGLAIDILNAVTDKVLWFFRLMAIASTQLGAVLTMYILTSDVQEYPDYYNVWGLTIACVVVIIAWLISVIVLISARFFTIQPKTMVTAR